MKKKRYVFGKTVNIATAIAFFAIIAVLVYGYIGGVRFPPEKLPLESLNIIGEYKIGESGAYEHLDEDTHLTYRASKSAETVYLYGHFNKDVPKNCVVSMRLSNAKVKLFLNGQQIFSFGDGGTYFTYSKSPGNVYVSFVSPGITMEDNIELQVVNVYPSFPANPVNDIINKTYMGFSETLIKDAFSQYGIMSFAVIVMMCFGFAFLIALIILTLSGSKDMDRYFYLVGLMLSVSARLAMSFEIIWVFMPYYVFNNLVAFWSLPAALIMFIAYLNTYAGKQIKRVTLPLLWVAIISVLVLILLSFTGADVFDFQSIYVTLTGWGLLFFIAFLLYDSFVKKNKELRGIVLSIGILAIFAVAEIHFYSRRLISQNIILLIGSVIFFAIQYVQAIDALIKTSRRAQEAQRLENELVHSNIALMLSQMQPHFIHNTLNAIGALCLTDPKAADKAIVQFSQYLRENIRSLESSEPITFNEELSHTKTYINIEKMRFDDILNVNFDINFIDFLIPTLTLQPIVENAIKHGVSKKPGGGTVTIKSEKVENTAVITVTDDGVGFDTNYISEQSIGIKNVQMRLRFSGGKLEITSKTNVGTTVVLYVPLKG